jgi:phosphohistidine phosphatase
MPGRPPRTLYLLRHAKSDWSDPSLRDRERPLARRGRRAAATIAHHMQNAGIHPAVVLCSPARRARETVEALLPVLLDSSIEFDDELYGAGVDELVSRVARVPAEVPSVMVIAHNPGLHELVERLGGTPVEKFPTAALATFTVDDWSDLEVGDSGDGDDGDEGDEGGGRVELVGIVRPKDLE